MRTCQPRRRAASWSRASASTVVASAASPLALQTTTKEFDVGVSALTCEHRPLQGRGLIGHGPTDEFPAGMWSKPR